MHADDDLPRRTPDLLRDLARQDLDPLSLDELDARVLALEAEIARTKAKRASAGQFRSAADALFRKG